MFAKLQPEDDTRDRHHRQIITRQLFIAGGNAAELLETIEALLDAVPFPIGRLIKGAAPPLVAFAGNDDPNAPLPQIAAEGATTVAFVSTHPTGTQVWTTTPLLLDRSLFQQGLRLRRFMPLSSGQTEGERLPLAIGAQVNFGREAPATFAEGLLCLPPFAPAAC